MKGSPAPSSGLTSPDGAKKRKHLRGLEQSLTRHRTVGAIVFPWLSFLWLLRRYRKQNPVLRARHRTRFSTGLALGYQRFCKEKGVACLYSVNIRLNDCWGQGACFSTLNSPRPTQFGTSVGRKKCLFVYQVKCYNHCIVLCYIVSYHGVLYHIVSCGEVSLISRKGFPLKTKREKTSGSSLIEKRKPVREKAATLLDAKLELWGRCMRSCRVGIYLFRL